MRMKAVVYQRYGSTDELGIEEIPKPKPRNNEVLVKVHAASVNSWDWDLVTGRPKILRLLSGLFKPRHKIIGSDISGTIEEIGNHVSRWKVGDKVYGDISGNGFGAFAEYVSVPENILSKIPQKMSFEQAATIPQAGILALQGLRDSGKIGSNQKILINGAGGGVGTFAIQYASMFNAEITAVDRKDKLEFLQKIGAHHVIDYESVDYTRNGSEYDIILDVIAKRSRKDYLRALAQNGKFVLVGGAMSTILAVLIMGGIASKKGQKKLSILAHNPNSNDLDYLSDLFNEGIIDPIIDKIFPLSETNQAVQYIGEGNCKGKIVIKII